MAVGGGDGDQGVLFVSFKRMDVYILIGAIQQKNKIADIEERGDGGGSDGLEKVGEMGHLEELALDITCENRGSGQ